MGAIKTQADAAWREYNVDGVPASGSHDPVKAEIRDWAGTIDTTVADLAGALISGVTLSYATKAAMDADLAHAAGVLAVVYNDPTVANNRIYYKVGSSGAGSWQPSPLLIDAATAIAVAASVEASLAAVQPLLDDAAALVATTEDLVDDVEALVAAVALPIPVQARFIDADQGVAGRTWRGDLYGPGTFTGWGVGWGDFAKSTLVRAAEMVMGNLPVVDKFWVRVWRRPLADAEAAGSLVPPGTGPNDVMKFDTAFNASDLLFGAPFPAIMTSIRFPFDGSIAGAGGGSMEGTTLTALPPGYIDMMTIEATLAGVAAYTSCGSAPARTDLLPEYRGYFSNAGGPYQEVSDPTNIAFLIYGAVGADYATEGMISPLFERPVLASTLDQRQTGTDIVFPSVRIERYSGDQIIPISTQTIPAPATESKTENFTLSLTSNTYLAYQFVRSVVVTRVSDSAVATIGTNVFVDINRGIVLALQAGWAVPVSIGYTGHKGRYDLMSSNQDYTSTDEALILTLGTEDATAPAEYRPGGLAGPAVPSNAIPLFSIFTMPDRSEVIHLTGGRQFLRYGRAGDLLELREKNQWRLRKTRGKLLTGATMRFGGDGDSITMMGDRAPGVNTTPDGASRDLISYFHRYSPALKALIPQSGGHTSCGWNNYIRDAWAESYPGATLTYENWGISGTDSSSGSFVDGGNTYYNGTAPTRMNAAGKAGIDVWNIAFGMNEISQQDDTPANLLLLGQTYRAAGADLIYTTLPMQAATFNNRDLRAWKQEQMDIVRVAEALDAAYVPVWWILGPGNEGLTGLSRWTHCDVTHQNHPGYEELKAIGEFAAFVLGL